MCTPLTIARLLRWRLREWASNVFTCRLPSDDEPDTFHSSVLHSFTKTEILESQDEIRSNATNQETASAENCNRDTLIPGTTSIMYTELPGNKTDSQLPSFRDEDYIVFCFKDDEVFDILKDKKSEASNTLECTIGRLRPVNRKLLYGEGAETVDKYSQEHMLSEDGADIDPTNEQESDISDEKDGESIYFDPESPPAGIREEQYEENEDYGRISLESSTSNQSDGRRSSFAFPVLGWEWSGSPVKMPKSGSMHLRKHGSWRVGVHCCRF